MLQEVYGKRLGSVWKVWEVNWNDEKCMRSMVSVWEVYEKYGKDEKLVKFYWQYVGSIGSVREVYWKGMGIMISV